MKTNIKISQFEDCYYHPGMQFLNEDKCQKLVNLKISAIVRVYDFGQNLKITKTS